jgi:DNA-directed RNA polymerase subunit M/transcription elongation factor TFIIS
MTNLVTIASCDDLSMAYIARSKLQAFGIPCFLTNEYLTGIHFFWGVAAQGVGLQVPAARAAEARMLLSGSRPPAGQTTEDVAPDPDPDSDPELEQALREPDYTCPRCGGVDMSRYSLRRPVLALSYLLLIPLRWKKSFYKCRICGHRWRERKAL